MYVAPIIAVALGFSLEKLMQMWRHAVKKLVYLRNPSIPVNSIGVPHDRHGQQRVEDVKVRQLNWSHLELWKYGPHPNQEAKATNNVGVSFGTSCTELALTSISSKSL